MTNASLLAAFATRLLDFMGEGAAPTSDPYRQFEDLALELFELQFASVPVYARFCTRLGRRAGEVSHWKDIPAITTAAFKEFELSSIPAEARTRVFWSSGTTARTKRSRHFHHDESLRLYAASLLPWFKAHLIQPWWDLSQAASSELSPTDSPNHGIAGGIQFLALTPEPESAPNSSLVCMMETVSQAGLFEATAYAGLVGKEGAWFLDAGKAVQFLRSSLASHAPVLIAGPAFSLVHLLDYLAQAGERFRLPAGSRVMETGGYKGRTRSVPRPELESCIGDWLGIAPSAIVSEYGMSELGSQAYATWGPGTDGSGRSTFLPREKTSNASCCSSARLFHFPPWARVKIISPETGLEVEDGQTGLIQVYDLANVFSVMAVQTQDLARREGFAFDLLGRAEEAEPRGCSLMLE